VNPGEKQWRRLGIARKKKGQCSWGKRRFGRVCSSTSFAEEKEKKRERDGHGCAQDGGRRALGSTVARAREDTGEGQG
jgi:hypothetical protein